MTSWRFTGFYGSAFSRTRADYWHVIKDLSLNNAFPWLVCGDFNEILYASEKVDGALRDEKRMDLFRETLNFFQLKDISFSSGCDSFQIR